MGVMVDSNVFIRFERSGASLALSPGNPDEQVLISVIVASELLVGVHRAKSPVQRERRAEFVDAILKAVRILDVTLDVARVHAELHSDLMNRGESIGAHDLLIAATALTYGHSLLTDNVREFSRIPGLKVIPFA